MSSRAFLAVSLLISSLFISSLGPANDTSFEWSHDLVVSGGSVTIKVTAAPCHPVTVLLLVDGETITGQIAEVPGTVTLQVPSGTAGAGYTIEVQCPAEADSKSGQVI